MKIRSRLIVTVLMLTTVLLTGYGHAQDELTTRILQLPVSIGENKTVVLNPGESWVDVGIRESVGYEHLRRANPEGFSSGAILIPGRHQLAGLLHDGLVINLPEMMNFHWVDGRPVARYPVAIGRVSKRTQTGQWRVINRVTNPAWRQPGGAIMAPGPRNPLGDRWLGLSRPGYGLHGTSEPTSIGRPASAGCIRHFPQHIRRLFADVQVGMPVVIMYETVTVGQQDDIVYLSIFPDVYARGTNNIRRVSERMAAFGLAQVMDSGELEGRIRQADGVARPMLGSTRPVMLNGAVLETPVGPTLRGSQHFLPLRYIAQGLGATIAWDHVAKTASVTHGEATIAFTVDGEDAFIALDTVFIPIRALVEGLGGTVSDQDGEGIIVTMPAGEQRASDQPAFE